METRLTGRLTGSAARARSILLGPAVPRSPRVTPRRLLHAGARIARLAAVVAAVAALALLRSNYPLPVYAAATAGALGLIYVALPRAAAFRWWAAYALGFVLFALLRALADETGVAWQYDYVIAAERALHLGAVPSVWLQDRLYVAGTAGALDWAAYIVYLSYFFAPHAAAVAIWRFAPRAFPTFVVAMLATFYAALAISFAVPTAPPWLAGQEGALPAVFLIKEHLTHNLSADAARLSYELVSANPVAAMPSLHVAITVVVALSMAMHRRAMAVAGALYTLAMGFALVYLGEHYVVDVLAGAALGAAAWWGARRLWRDRAPPAADTGERA